MRFKRLTALVAAGVLLGLGVAQAAHVTEVDPSTVPVGFLAAHSAIDHFPVSAVAHAVEPDGSAEVSVQHISFAANAATIWHSHPGPAIVTVVEGTFVFEDARRGQCHQTTYVAGEGFVDEGFGHVHRGVAGNAGAELYVTYILPVGSATHIIPATAPTGCTG